LAKQKAKVREEKDRAKAKAQIEAERAEAKQEEMIRKQRERDLAKHNKDAQDAENKMYDKAWIEHVKADAEQKKRQDIALRAEERKVKRIMFKQDIVEKRKEAWGDAPARKH
jgi:hypothetical protein